MGISTTVATAIVFIGLLTFVSSILGLLFNTTYLLMEIYSNVNYDVVRTRIEISDVTVSNDSIVMLIKNLGPGVIHLVNYGYSWCSIVISYNSSLGWVTYLIDNYVVNNITVLNTDVSYSLPEHSFINPGEGAWITARIPEGAPEIMSNSPVVIVFSTRFGEVAMYEVVRNA